MDERLAAGRHHLLNGERAIQQGFPDDSRMHFGAALLQFRGPDLRLGEGHALRGLAQVEILVGDSAAAEKLLREAIAAYQAVREALDRLDSGHLSHELRSDAAEGEGAAMVLLGDLLVQVGRIDEAHTALGYAKEIYNDLGELPSAAGVHSANGRLLMHLGKYDDAIENFMHALAIHENAGNLAGQVQVWLVLAELRRITRDLKGAEKALFNAREAARNLKNTAMEARAVGPLATLMLQQGRMGEARDTYGEALLLARRANDTEQEGFVLLGLGEAKSRMHEGLGLDEMIEGTRVLASLENYHGVATGLLRIGEHGLRIKNADLALIGGEAARRMYQRTDPVRGVGYAWRVIVKALAGRKDWTGVLVAAIARESIAGAVQQNARDVADFYRQRSPQGWVEELKPLGPKGIIEQAEKHVLAGIKPMLAGIEVPVEVLDSPDGAVSVIEALAMRLPKPEGPEAWEAPEPPPPPDPALVGDAPLQALLTDLPPDEEISSVYHRAPTPPPVPQRVAAPPQKPVPAPEPAVDDLPFDAIEPLTEEVMMSSPPAGPAAGYEGFYDAPEVSAAEAVQVPEPAPPAAPDAPEEPVVVPEELKKAPTPKGYDYDPPDAE